MNIINRPAVRGIWKFGNTFDLSREVFISMSPTNYHCFIVSGEKEFHPRFSFNKAKVMTARPDRIRAGVFLRLKGLAPEEIEGFQRYLSRLNGIRTPSCHLGVLQALRAGLSLRIKNIKTDQMRPNQFLTSLLSSGLERQDGRLVDFDVYVLKEKSMEGVLEEVRFFEQKFRWAYLLSDVCYFFIRILAPHRVIHAK